ncbi:flavin reductase family protein [Roseobacter sp. YSTF-M11]|uniref:Flavin reductase family protein n=1 Tax=Roseobacter insulae TaxID=2859783 RepID=A0A9X1K4Q8_9RHOB|nr:flavin reductase family protein [Roseobacter insulae]MBW4709962.1 flavin reductase family protein [Roseobacter insulae]
MPADPNALRHAFGRFMTGVAVVTTRTDEGNLVGFTANSFTSVSLNPPLLLVCPGNHLSSFAAFSDARRFGVSILSEGQEDISNTFASGKADRFGLCDWEAPAQGIPLITGRAAGFVCERFQVIPAGDHLVLIGRVIYFDSSDHAGLGYGPDGYFTLENERKAEALPVPHTRASVLLEDGDHLYLTEDADLFTICVPTDESPLQALTNGLKAAGIAAELSVVYAAYDEGANGRRIVFRGHSRNGHPALHATPIDGIAQATIPDQALKSLLRRFENEHRRQSFGFYIGNEHSGDVFPVTER